jgi:exonuclease V gamma subunit
VVRDWLENELDADSFGSGFLVGGMTIAALKPMRSCPFVSLPWPDSTTASFRAATGVRRSTCSSRSDARGDRDLRSDDRQLFLDYAAGGGRSRHDCVQRARRERTIPNVRRRW